MSEPVRPLPTWFAALLIGEIVVALLGAILLAVVFLAYTTQPTSIDTAAVVLVSALPLLVVVGAAALARRLWRRTSREAAILTAIVPFVLGVPFLAMLFGVGI